jgi:hypothetical protein
MQTIKKRKETSWAELRRGILYNSSASTNQQGIIFCKIPAIFNLMSMVFDVLGYWSTFTERCLKINFLAWRLLD